MLWFDVVNILYVIVGFLMGYIMCCLINKDIMDDECEDCEYRKFIEEVINNGE